MSPVAGQPPFVEFGQRSMWMLRTAYATAVRRGAESVSTLDVLAQIALHDRSIPGWPPPGTRNALSRMAGADHGVPIRRPVGELIGGQPTRFDDQVQATLREVEWRVRQRPPWPSRGEGALGTRPTWTPAVPVVLAGALHAAVAGRVAFAGPAHLAYGMLELPGCAATERIYPYDFGWAAAARQWRTEPALRWSDAPHPDFEPDLEMMMPGGRLPLRLITGIFARAARFARLGPLVVAVEGEARRQAVRLGHGVVGPGHLLLAMLVVDAHLAVIGERLPASHSSRNHGGDVLRVSGVEATRLHETVLAADEPAEPPAEVLTRQISRIRPGDPFDGAEFAAAMERTQEISLAYRHPGSGTSHLLLALIENDDGAAVTILRELGVDVAAARDRVERDLRAAPAAWPGHRRR